MKGRLIATVASVTAAIALSSGVFALPAAADTSTLTTAVFDASSNTTWGTGPEVTGASAYDTSVVVPDVSSPAGGTLTYSLYPNGTCDDPATSTQTVTLNADGSVPNSDATGAMGAGAYSFQATYNGDGVNDPSSGVCEPFTVGTATSSTTAAVFDAGTNTAWAGTETAGARAYDTAIVTGVSGITPTGTVTYSFFDNGSCASDANTTTDTETLAGGVVPNSTTQGPLGTGSYSFQATYSGDANYGASPPSSCEPFSVGLATATTSTSVFDAGTNTAWAGTETAGARAYDTAIVTGVSGITPTGTVTYSFFDNGSCASDANTTTDTETLAGGVVPNSTTQGPLGTGSYSFQATYSGDANYGASPPSSCEPFSVGLATATTSTSVFDAGTNTAWAGTETAGARAYDTAIVTGVPGITPTGTVTYSFFDNGSCASDANTTRETDTMHGGVVPTSGPQGPLGTGSYSFQATYSGDANYGASLPSACEPFAVGKASPSTATVVFDAGTNSSWAGTETAGARAYDTATVTGVPGITPTGTVTYSFFDNGSCASDANTTTDTVTLAGGVVPNSTTQGPLAAQSYSFQATYHGDTNYGASPPSSCEPFSVDKASSSATTIVFDAGSNEPWNGTEVTQSSAYDTSTVTGVAGITPGGTLTYTYFTNATCSGSGSPAGTVTLAGNGSVPHSSTEGPLTPQTYSFDATYNGDGNYSASPVSTCEEFTVAQGTASPPSIINIPQSAVYGGSFAAAVSTTGNGPKSVTSSTPGFCTVGSDGLTVNYVGAGTCTVTAHVAGTTNYAGATGQPQSFTVARATPSSPVVDNVPGVATEFQSFVAAVLTSGDGIGAVTSSTGGVCTVGADGLTVTFVGFGTCTLTPSVGQGANYLGRTGAPQTFTVNPAARGYWLVGSDGGIFSFGAAAFHGSMGGIPLQRPVVGITPTASRNGYWLVASDGGIFAFGDSAYYGSIPGIGLHPAGSGQPDSLDAPIVGVVPSTSGHGYFMVASDGGVFSFGDARFAGSCPGIGGCDGAAVAVMPDSTGNGYWLVTSLGAVYAFGDAGNYGEPPPQSAPVVDAVATPDGHGYWVLFANGAVFGFGDAADMGAPVGYVNSFNPAAAIFPTADGKGYWVAAAHGDVFSYGDAPFMGSMAATDLNGKIIAGYGF